MSFDLDATTNSKLSDMRRRFRRSTQLDAEQAILGDENGAVSVSGESHYYWVRFANGTNADGSTQYGRAFPVLSGAGYDGSEQVGTEVYIAIRYDGLLGILGTDRGAIIEDGRNPRAENVNGVYRQFVYMKNADLFYALPMGTQQTPTMEIRVAPTSYIKNDGTHAFFAGELFDLSGNIPAADGDSNSQHLIAAVFVDPATNALESATSTAQLLDNELTWTGDVVEAFNNRSSDAFPIRFYRLFTGHTLLTKADEFGDGRQFVNTPKNATAISIRKLSGATIDDVQGYIDNYGSTGLLSGGVMSDGGSQEVAITDIIGFIREANDHDEPLHSFDLSSISNQAVATDTFKYIGVEYNSGSPQIVLKDTDTWNMHTEFPLGNTVNEGDTLHVLNNPQRVTNFGAHALERFYKTSPFKRNDRDGGIILGETGTRNVTLSLGGIYDRLTEFSIAAIDTTGADRFDIYYRDGNSGFTKVATQAQWDNDSYDNDSGILATLTNNRWASIWWYIEPNDGNLVAQYGRAQFVTEAACLADDTIPGTAPDRLVLAGKLIGRFIFQKNAGTTGIILSEFDTMSTPSIVSDHGEMSGLGDDDHTQYALLAGRSGGQTIIGGTVAGDDLTLQSTSDGTKGEVILGTTENVSVPGTLELSAGTTANEISIDGTLAGNSDNAIPTEQAVKTYVDANSGTVNMSVMDCRLTLTSGTPVTTSDVTGTTLYLTPYDGEQITLYDGSSAWEYFTLAEINITNAGLALATNYDVFLFDSGGLTLQLVAWTNDTTRATAIVQQDGVDVKSGATTHRLVATIRTYDGGGGTVTFADVSTGGSSPLAAPARRFVSNRYNRVERPFVVEDDRDSTTSNTVAADYWMADANNSVEFVDCISKEPQKGWFSIGAVNNFVYGNFALDGLTKHANSISTFSGTISSVSSSGIAAISLNAGIGKHTLYPTQYVISATVATIFGDAGVPTQLKMGASGMIWG